MDRYQNQNCVERRKLFQFPGPPPVQGLVFEPARRIMDLPLDYVPNPQFEAWSRDKRAENVVLGPMPARQRTGGRGRATLGPGALRGQPLRSAAVDPRAGGPPLPQAELLEVQDQRAPREAQSFAAEKNAAGPDREALPGDRRHAEPDHLRQSAAGGLDRQAAPRADAELFRTRQRWKRVADAGGGTVRLLLGEQVQHVRHLGNRQQFRPHHSGKPAHRDRFRTDHSGLFTATARHPTDHMSRRPPTPPRDRLDGILRRLNDREREIIVCRFGLRRGDEPQTLQQVGDVMGVSKERIRQIEARALSKLRQVAAPEMLLEAMERCVS